ERSRGGPLRRLSLPGVLLATGLATSACYWLLATTPINMRGKQLCPRNDGGGGGSRTPVRKALRHEAYMLSSIPLGSPATLRMSKKRSRLVRWFSPEPYGPKDSGQLTV